jgi:peroxiredoxin
MLAENIFIKLKIKKMKLIVSSIVMFFCLLSSVSFYAQIAPSAKEVCPILIGEKIPDAVLKNNKGDSINLLQKISEQPTVMVFYRGGWCPFCNVQLSSLAKSQKAILKLGYQIVAISPDNYKNLKSIEDSNQIKYTLLSDPLAEFIQKIGIGFKTNDKTQEYLKSKEQIATVLPVPTVLVLDKQGTVLFEYINPNYKERLSSEMLLAVLKTLKK